MTFIHRCLVIVALAIIQLGGTSCEKLAAIDIGTMTWTPRSDWINIKSCSSITGGSNAVGDGTTDDTAAIQAALTYLCSGGNQNYSTIYFPAGTYKISSTLTMTNFAYGQIIGCGSNTTIIWGGPSGKAMFNPQACSFMHYWGLKWDGANLASCAFLDDFEGQPEYVSRAHHDNESFQNFTVTGTYPFTDNNDVYHPSGGAPPAALITGFYYGLCADSLVTNCRFYNCTNGIMVGYLITQIFQWHLDGCEFDNCDVGFNSGGGGYDCIILNTHFQNSTTSDMSRGGGLHVRHCTSTGSAAFFNEQGTNLLQDCWVDGWTNASISPVQFVTAGTHTVFDCRFTNPPANAVPPIEAYGYGYTESILLSNNYAPDFAGGYGIINNPFNATNDVHFIPSGARTGIVTSASQTFLNTAATTDSANIIDVSQSPYSADKTGRTDCTSAIQAALAAAATANNGSIVYFPYGTYSISTTLAATGSNYIIQGSGCRSSISWNGTVGGTLMTITNPNNVKVQNLDFFSSSASPTSPGIQELASYGGSATYDGVYYGAPYRDNNTNPGLVLTNLPASSTVYIPYSETPLTVQNSGDAEIFCRTFLGGEINVSGAGSKNGFLGIMDVENIEQEDPSGYVISVTDNQNLVIGDHYTESDFGDIHLSAGTGTTPGRFAIQGENDAVWDSSTFVQIDNYQGSAFIGNYAASNYSGNYSTAGVSVPVKVTQTGSNPVDLMLVGLNTFDGPPTVSVDSGANLIEAGNFSLIDYSHPNVFAPDTPNPLTQAASQKLAAGFDDIRQLGAVDLSMQFGIDQIMTNPAFEADVPNPAPLTTLGYNPSGWTVTNNVALGSGVRNMTVTTGSSPFAAGHQSLLYVDSTANTGGDKMYAVQNLTPTSTTLNSPAIETFDFRANISANSTDLWFVTSAEWNGASAIHIAVNGPSGYGYFGANVGGSDSYLTTITAGTWYRVQIVYGSPVSGAAHATLYLTPWYGNGPGPTSNFTIDSFGAPQTGGYNQVVIYTGTGPGAQQSMNIDNFSITTNTPLTIPANTGNEPGLVAHWTLDEAVGNTSSDTSGGGIDGTWENAPTFSPIVPSALTFRDPGCLTFDGTDQCVNMGNPINLPAGSAPRTICGWAKADSAAGGYAWIASYGSPNTDQAMFIGRLGDSLVGGGYGGDDVVVPSFWEDDNWHFIALTYDGTTAKLYADGTLLASQAKSWNLVPGACYIGEQVNGGDEYWDGSIDDVRIYDRVLSATEISDLADGGR